MCGEEKKEIERGSGAWSVESSEPDGGRYKERTRVDECNIAAVSGIILCEYACA